MRRIELAALLCLIAFTAPASELPGALAALPAALETLHYHLRVEPLKNRAAVCTVYWNVADNGDCRAIEFTVPSLLDDDPRLGFEARYKYMGHSGGVDTVYCTGSVKSRYRAGSAGFSFILKATPDGASVSFGGDAASTALPVDFALTPPGRIGYTSDAELKELRNTVYYRAMKEPETAPFANVEALKEHIASSNDPLETFWTYLDRDTKPEKALLGGTYTLATVAEGNGSYIIVYIDGATNGRQHWQPLRIKGRLRPTGFANHYSLEWLDAAGRDTGRENSADLLLDTTVLRLNFPLHEATLRLTR